jgi:hypothetical protein
MTITDRSADQKSSATPPGDKEPRRRSGIIGVLRRLASRIFGARARTTFGGMTYEQYTQFASDHKPPQQWYEQDLNGLQGPDR